MGQTARCRGDGPPGVELTVELVNRSAIDDFFSM